MAPTEPPQVVAESENPFDVPRNWHTDERDYHAGLVQHWLPAATLATADLAWDAHQEREAAYHARHAAHHAHLAVGRERLWGYYRAWEEK